MVRVALIGADGKMGRITQQAMKSMPEFQLVAKILNTDSLMKKIEQEKPDIAIDFSNATSVHSNAWTLVKAGVKPLIGASGLEADQIVELKTYCNKQNLGGMVVPNFSLAFAIINKASKELAKFYEFKSIIEFHHTKKVDSPSGTSKHSAHLINLPESNIQSVRSDAFLAKQQIYFGSSSERILIDHESFSRESFIVGIQLCLKKIVEATEFMEGLENIID